MSQQDNQESKQTRHRVLRVWFAPCWVYQDDKYIGSLTLQHLAYDPLSAKVNILEALETDGMTIVEMGDDEYHNTVLKADDVTFYDKNGKEYSSLPDLVNAVHFSPAKRTMIVHSMYPQ